MVLCIDKSGCVLVLRVGISNNVIIESYKISVITYIQHLTIQHIQHLSNNDACSTLHSYLVETYVYIWYCCCSI